MTLLQSRHPLARPHRDPRAAAGPEAPCLAAPVPLQRPTRVIATEADAAMAEPLRSESGMRASAAAGVASTLSGPGAGDSNLNPPAAAICGTRVDGSRVGGAGWRALTPWLPTRIHLPTWPGVIPWPGICGGRGAGRRHRASSSVPVGSSSSALGVQTRGPDSESGHAAAIHRSARLRTGPAMDSSSWSLRVARTRNHLPCR